MLLGGVGIGPQHQLHGLDPAVVQGDLQVPPHVRHVDLGAGGVRRGVAGDMAVKAGRPERDGG